MIIGTHRLTENQTAVVERATSCLLSSQVDDFLKYLSDRLRGKPQVRHSDLNHAVCAGLQRFGAARE
jgi:hypothetical protein